MSSTSLWSIFPFAIAAVLLFYRRKDNFVLFVTLLLSIFLSWMAWQIPVDTVLHLGPYSLEIFPNQLLLGRNFVLGQVDLPLLTQIYLWESLWLLGALLAKPGRLFAPISLMVVAVCVAALSVEPFLYAALMMAGVVLLLVPLLTPADRPPGNGVQRYLKFQLFAVPCILFTGWLLLGVESSPGNFSLLLRVDILIALGFSFLLGLFPFHSWIPMLAEESNPYTFSFLIFFLPSVASIFFLSFFDRYVWLRESELVSHLLLFAGSLGCLLGGLWAASEHHLSRIFGFTALVAVGNLLQAIGLGGSIGVQTFFAILLPQAWTIWLFGLASSVFWREERTMQLEDYQESFRSHPLLAIGILAALFAFAGFPFLGAFAGHLRVWVGLTLFSPWALVASILGSLGLIIAAMRVMLACFGKRQDMAYIRRSPDVTPFVETLPDLSNPYVLAFSILGLAALLGYGILPQLFSDSLPALAARFPQLFP